MNKTKLAKLIYRDLIRYERERIPSLQEQIQGLIKATSHNLELKTKKQLQSIMLSVNTINKKLAKVAQEKDFEIADRLKKDMVEINKSLVENQKVIDQFIKSKENEQN